jgi:hypothetical protein
LHIGLAATRPADIATKPVQVMAVVGQSFEDGFSDQSIAAKNEDLHRAFTPLRAPP